MAEPATDKRLLSCFNGHVPNVSDVAGARIKVPLGGDLDRSYLHGRYCADGLGVAVVSGAAPVGTDSQSGDAFRRAPISFVARCAGARDRSGALLDWAGQGVAAGCGDLGVGRCALSDAVSSDAMVLFRLFDQSRG